MDRLKDRLAALAEEVSELVQPPGVAVTVRRARRRRQRAVGLVALGLLTVAVVGLAGSNPLEGFRQGKDPGLLGGADTPTTTAVSPATTRSPGPRTLSLIPRGRAPGEQWRVVGGGCYSSQQGEVSIARLGIRKSVPINKDGRFSTLLTVPRTATAGTYDLTVRCLTRDSDPEVVRAAVVVTDSNK